MQIPISLGAALLPLLASAQLTAAQNPPKPAGTAAQTPVQIKIKVDAGDFDRLETLVSFPLPASAGKTEALRDEQGRLLPLQTDQNGNASFLLHSLPKGAAKSFTVVPAASAQTPFETLQAAKIGSTLRITSGAAAILHYQAEPSDLPRPGIKPLFQRGGYLHPVFSPSGNIVTDDYPPNHIHHHGIWFPWTKTEFDGRHPDFWNMGEGTGKVEFTSLPAFWSGPVHAGFLARHRFLDLTAPNPAAALLETWEVRVYHLGSLHQQMRVFDLHSIQECAASIPLRLPKYHYGGLGVRGNWAWNGKDETFFLTSEGESDRVRGNETRGRWCRMSGRVDGKLTGIAILCHPDNFRAPQPMRLHPSEPFFCYAPSQLGDWQIQPNHPYHSRYRFVVQDGPSDPKELDRLWRDYAHPPAVTVE